ncbi:MAG: hypothetical protein U1F53_18555 [Burkholderiaceae bacterium]
MPTFTPAPVMPMLCSTSAPVMASAVSNCAMPSPAWLRTGLGAWMISTGYMAFTPGMRAILARSFGPASMDRPLNSTSNERRSLNLMPAAAAALRKAAFSPRTASSRAPSMVGTLWNSTNQRLVCSAAAAGTLCGAACAPATPKVRAAAAARANSVIRMEFTTRSSMGRRSRWVCLAGRSTNKKKGSTSASGRGAARSWSATGGFESPVPHALCKAAGPSTGGAPHLEET